MFQLLTDQGQPHDISDTDFILAMFTKSRQEDECILLIGTFVELIDQEVLKQKDLLFNTVIGVPKNKPEYTQM